MNKLKILVIGASGFVGGELYNFFREKHEVIGTYNSKKENGFVHLDITNKNEIEEVASEFSSNFPDVIIMPAAIPNVERCEECPEETRKVNVEGTKNVADFCRKNNIKLVFFSSDYIWDGKTGPYKEGEPPSPVSEYGVQKAEAEKIVEKLDDFLILRTTVVYGWEKNSKNFADKFIKSMRQGVSWRVPIGQCGNPTYVKDLAKATLELVEKNKKGIFNLSGPECMPRSEFAFKIADVFDLDKNLIKPVESSVLGQKAARPEKGGFIIEKLNSAISFSMHSPDEALQLMKKEESDNMQGKNIGQKEESAEEVRQKILELVKKYYDLHHAPKEFIEGQSKVQYAGRVYDDKEMVNAVDSMLEFWLTQGRFTDEFEKKLAEFLGVKYAMITNSGSSANLLAMSALCSPLLKEKQLKPGDEVITVAASFPTTINPIFQNNLVPVFLDVELGTYNIDVSRLDAALSENTKAIFVAHTLGNPYELDKIKEFADKHGLFLIEDCCDALASKYDGKMVGTFGVMGTLSFFPAHHMSCSKGTEIPYLDENNSWKLEPIGEIYEKYSKQPKPIKVLSFDNEFKVNWTKPSSILRHKLGNKKMVKITAQHGRSVEVTTDHSVFVLDKENLEVVPKFAKDIKEDDYLVGTNNIPHANVVKYLEFIEAFKDKNAYVSGFDEKNLSFVKNRDYAWQYKSRNSLPIEYLRTYDLDKEKIMLGVFQSHEKIPARIALNEEFYRLVGYFLSEGSYQNGLIFSFHKKEVELISDVTSIIKNVFGVECSLIKQKENCVNVKASSKNLEIVFKDALKIRRGAKNKRIPGVMYGCSKECVLSFVYAYTKGDGSYRKLPDNYNRIDVTSVSKDLLNDLQYLLSKVGISASFYRRNKAGKRLFPENEGEGSENYSLAFSGHVYANKSIEPVEKHKSITLAEQIPVNAQLTRQIPKLKWQKTVSKTALLSVLDHKILSGDLSFYKVRKIEAMEYSPDEYVYDFSVPDGQNFYGGFMGLFLHNTMGEGGAVFTNNSLLYRILQSYRDWGRDCYCKTGKSNTCGKRFGWKLGKLPFGYDHKFIYSHIGYNLKVLDVGPAIGIAQLDKLPKFIEARKRNFNSLYKGFSKYEKFFILPRASKKADVSWFGFLVTVKDGAPFTKNDIVNHFENNNVATRALFAGNLTKQPAYEHSRFRIAGSLENTDKIMESTFFLGVYPGITPEMASYMIKVLDKFMEAYL